MAAQTTVGAGRVGHEDQLRAYAADALTEAGTPAQISAFVRYVIANAKRMQARNAMREASVRVHAAANFR